MPFCCRNCTFSSGYGSGHRYLIDHTSNDDAVAGQGRRELKRQARTRRWSSFLHDGAQVEGEQEAEVGGVREARAEDAVVDHGEVERRHQGVGVGVGPRAAAGERELRVAPWLNAEDAHGHCLAVLLCILGAPLPRRNIQLHRTH